MPTYDYQCMQCGGLTEVNHPIAELEKPSKETKKAITCCGTIMVRTYVSPPGIKTPTGTKFALKERKKRNHNHFVKEGLPSITDPDSKRHHLKKLGYNS